MNCGSRDYISKFIKEVYSGKNCILFSLFYFLKLLLFATALASLILFICHICLHDYDYHSTISASFSSILLLLILLVVVFIATWDSYKVYQDDIGKSINDVIKIRKYTTPKKKEALIRLLENDLSDSNSVVNNLTNAVFTLLTSAGITLISNWFVQFLQIDNVKNLIFPNWVFLLGMLLLAISVALSLFFASYSVWSVEKKREIVFLCYKNILQGSLDVDCCKLHIENFNCISSRNIK